MLVQITGDRSDLVERIRQEYLTGENSLGTSDRAVLLLVTSGFERVIWMKHPLARLLEQRTAKTVGHSGEGARLHTTSGRSPGAPLLDPLDEAPLRRQSK